MNAKTCVQLFGDNLIGQTMRCTGGGEGAHPRYRDQIARIIEIHPFDDVVAVGESIPAFAWPVHIYGHNDLTRVEWNDEKNRWDTV